MSERRIGTFSQLFPPKPTWTAEDVPDQTGKTVIITGGNSGIGKGIARVRAKLRYFSSQSSHTEYECIQVLLSKGAKVYIATRSKEKSDTAIEELKRDTGKESVFYLQLDLSDLVSVKTAAEEFIGKETELHTLYNNG
jgi:NAD(P)-dependent dehydrogenase (short-subunit alcohol dehydrogenase family)